MPPITERSKLRERVERWPAETEARTIILGLLDEIDRLEQALAEDRAEREDPYGR